MFHLKWACQTYHRIILIIFSVGHSMENIKCVNFILKKSIKISPRNTRC